MFWLIYLLSAILCIWGGCLLARVIANRLELGLFRRKQRKEAVEAAGASSGTTASVAGMPEVRKRSGWWTLVGLGVMLFGAGVSFTIDAVDAMIANGREWRSGDFADHFMTTTLLMSLGLAGGLAVVGFRFDPSLGRRRCPKCWYNLHGTKGRLCPECGHEASSERQLYRSKRSRVTIALAALPLLVYPITTRVLYATKVGPMGLIPTTVMVLGWEWMPDKVTGNNQLLFAAGAGQRGTLVNRLEEGHIWKWQRDLLSWRCRETMRSTTDVRRMCRASMLDAGELTVDSAFVQSLRPRFGKLIASVDWTDPESRVAFQWLMMSVTPAIDSEAVQQELVNQIVAHAPVLLGQLAKPPVGWDIAALTALGYPGVAGKIGQPWLDAIEVQLAATTTPAFHRHHCVRTLYENGGSAFIPIIERVLGNADEGTRLQIVQAGLGISQNSLFVDHAVNLIRTCSEKQAEGVVATLFGYPNPRVREECLTKFLLDQHDKATCLQGIQQSLYHSVWSPEHMDKLKSGLTKSLQSPDSAVVREALTMISAVNALPELMRTSLEELAKSPGTRNGSIAKTILDRLPPTLLAEPKESP